MDCQFQRDIPGQTLPEDWHALLARHTRILKGMLARVAETVAAVNAQPDRTP